MKYSNAYRDSPHFVQDIIEDTVEREGGYVDNPDDSGGETNFGVTVKTARAYGYKGEMKNLTEGEAKDILTYGYFNIYNLDEMYKLSPEITREVFDSGVLSGVKTPILWLQRCLNVFNYKGEFYDDLAMDGDFGRKSQKALKSFIDKRGEEGIGVLFNSLNCIQGNFFISLALNRPKDETFVYGWMKNRLEFL